jgi:glycosyltransferase involved in cell wall biosynthesis
MLELSVIICSHNPRPEHLDRALSALAGQSLARETWELILIDNASERALAELYSLAWHPRARHVREENLGLTPARLRGIAEGRGHILVFVDDDNILDQRYLETVLDIASAHPRLGAWSGNVELEFETPPAEWTRPFWPFLVERKVDADNISSNSELREPLPVGAGLCVRRAIGEAYVKAIETSEWRRQLDRKGASLNSAGDLDLALTACDLGYGRGVFQRLHLRHIIPPERLTEAYLLRLVKSIQFSSYVLQMCRNPVHVPPAITWWWWLKFLCDSATKFGRKRSFYLANKRAQREARALYDKLNPVAQGGQ